MLKVERSRDGVVEFWCDGFLITPLLHHSVRLLSLRRELELALAQRAEPLHEFARILLRQ